MSTFGVDGNACFEAYLTGGGPGSDAGPASHSHSHTQRRLLEDVRAVRQQYEDVWHDLDERERRQLLDEHLIPPEVVLQYEHEPAPGGAHARAGAGDAPTLPFHASQVYPRLIQASGLKKVLVEDTVGSQGDLDSASSCQTTYTFQDEHSAPFTWRTKSQQDLTLLDPVDVGHPGLRPDSMAASEDSEAVGAVIDNEHTLLTSSPSKILSRPNSTLARYSRGHPSFAKAVQIPQVPLAGKHPPKRPDSAVMTSPAANHGVAPERINNFVYESSPNRLVLDFGEIQLDENNLPVVTTTSAPSENGSAITPTSDTPLRSSSPESTKSSRSLLAKVKKSFSTRRRKSQDARSPAPAPGADATDANSAEAARRLSSVVSPPTISSPSPLPPPATSSATTTLNPRITKPSVAPPPPPLPPSTSSASAQSSKPQPTPSTAPPPPPPTASTSASAQMVEHKKPPKSGPPPPPPVRRSSISPTKQLGEACDEKNQEDKPDDEGKLEEFKIDLKTDPDLPKTGFDFLDNW